MVAGRFESGSIGAPRRNGFGSVPVPMKGGKLVTTTLKLTNDMTASLEQHSCSTRNVFLLTTPRYMIWFEFLLQLFALQCWSGLSRPIAH